MSLSAESSARWLQRISRIQCERMTPEDRAQLSERVERMRRTECARRSSRTISGHATLSSALLGESLRQMSTSRSATEYKAVSIRFQTAQRRNTELTAQTIQHSDLNLASMDVDESTTACIWRDEFAERERLMETALLVGATDADVLAAPEDMTVHEGELDALLEQLRMEPQDDEEVRAKFVMYETYAEEVGRMREAVFGFYERHQGDLPVAVSQDMSKQLKRIDNADAMGVLDDERIWFVFHMMKQSSKNNRKMQDVLKSFERRLELLAKAEQQDCPICLEGGKETETLGCCHTVCRECWQNWAEACHGQPFCPLCRHEAFLQTVATAAGPAALAPLAGVPLDERSPYVRQRPPQERAPGLLRIISRLSSGICARPSR